MTHYETLGVADTATAEEIKKAYRKLASQHHPDRGGVTATFQNIQSAYDTLSDDARRQQYDLQLKAPSGFNYTVNGQQMPPGADPFNGQFRDIFQNFGFHFGQDPFSQFKQQPRRNKDLRIDIPLDLASTLTEQTKTVSVQTTNGHRETVEVKIPRGVTHGSVIKYSGLGDNFFNTLDRGDLHVHLSLLPHPNYRIDGIDIVTNSVLNCLAAMTGTTIEVIGIDSRKFNVNVPAGCQHNAILRIKDEGLWELNGLRRGSLLVIINLVVPKNLNEDQLSIIRQIQQSL